MAFPLTNDDVTSIDANNTPAGATGPVRYLSLDHVYSATSPCVTATSPSNVMSKKVKARKLNPNPNHFHDSDHHNRKPPLPNPTEAKPDVVLVYTRRDGREKRPRQSLYDAALARAKPKDEPMDEDELEILKTAKKKRRKTSGSGSNELARLGVGDSSVLLALSAQPRLRECRSSNQKPPEKPSSVKKRNLSAKSEKKVVPSKKQWIGLNYSGVEPKTFIGLQCKVYWALDGTSYNGRIVGYNSNTNKHHIEYEDEDQEHLVLAKEKVKFYISQEEMEGLNLSRSLKNIDNAVYDRNELIALAVILDQGEELEEGGIIWAKLSGHAPWPAIIVGESLICGRGGLSKSSVGGLIPVQFFGTHDYASINFKQAESFLKGLFSSYDMKSKKSEFRKSLEEVKMYMKEYKLPQRMIQLRDGIRVDDYESESGEDEMRTDSGDGCLDDIMISRSLDCPGASVLFMGDLQIIRLGRVRDSKYLKDEKDVWPEGYTAVRKFPSVADPSISALYKMEVVRDPESKIRPLFQVSLDNGEQYKGSTPSACWNKIYKKMREVQNGAPDDSNAAAEDGSGKIYKSGSEMFGFTIPEVAKLIQGLLQPGHTSKVAKCKSVSRRYRDVPVGYRPVQVDWKDLDKCSVCHMDEEYENNLFLQCDKCRMMVHARCYGELEPMGGVLWLCNLCRPGAPEPPPSCCLCPVIGGAMKPTTDGRWAHLACAIWIPETCLSDIKRMEPIDGLSRINKDRWKLLCSICGVSYGACIQCSNHTCYAAYHPLCARAAALCVELEDEERLHLLSVDDDEEGHCIRFLSFCKKHRQPTNDRSTAGDRIGRTVRQCSDYSPPSNLSRCARTEPYNYSCRRGRKEPEAIAAASLKRLFVENQPYLIGGYSQHQIARFSSRIDASTDILSMAEKYKYMRDTLRKRLAFGKSGIHGFGVFAKHPHRAGDMVIEYTGELVRPPIADRRERFIYNSLVGAGTYMFRIDEERVIDATRAGSIAHLINHSCEPNCYSRVISVNSDEHIIIFAKRDIKRWEELTYDYRFFSIDEQLSCYCGFPQCRGVVNDVEERGNKLYAPRSDLIHWTGEW